MTTKKSYNRYFIIFQEEDKGFGIAIDKQPTGYTKIETRNGKCKITVYVQNLIKEKGPYNCILLDATKTPAVLAKLGEIKIDDTGRGETWWEYPEDNIADTNTAFDRFNVAAVVVGEDTVISPLSGYVGKERLIWKDKLPQKTRAYETDEHEDNIIDEEILDEEGLKFKEYEKSIRDKAIENMDMDYFMPEGVQSDVVRSEDDDTEEKMEYNDNYQEEIYAGNFEDVENRKEKRFADIFHKLLKNFQEENQVIMGMKNVRWWKIPYNVDIPMVENKYYPYHCAIHHLKMTYPYINYIKYFKKHGHYYFGLKYDDRGEIKYIIYGIEGRNMPMEHPYMGMTGFVKWMPANNKSNGMWLMYYNPYTGCIMIPKKR
ncbi:hypothetical protein Q428_00140 [Fervidicella metallireducens AeB]|uniref:Uncharacterized protein n=1 Tax=Fervidicella metallireducens AeB TaxID=1403537 RepID=A0A017S101_9CLOT|nr:hypothetical protein [Fervidicella metallireducens]EYE89855.1 hypothetical protein Q428_00140 [Fervidicella metallireducens AeB]